MLPSIYTKLLFRHSQSTTIKKEEEGCVVAQVIDGGRMETKTLPTILFAVIVACLLFTASSARSSFAIEGEDDGERYTGALRWKPKGEEQTTANTKLRIEMCERDYCGHKWTKCYCCTLLPGEPCYFDQQKCWNICPNKPAALEIAPSSAPADKQQQLPS